MLVTSTKRKLKPVRTILNHSIDWFATVLEFAQFKDGAEVTHMHENALKIHFFLTKMFTYPPTYRIVALRPLIHLL